MTSGRVDLGRLAQLGRRSPGLVDAAVRGTGGGTAMVWSAATVRPACPRRVLSDQR